MYNIGTKVSECLLSARQKQRRLYWEDCVSPLIKMGRLLINRRPTSNDHRLSLKKMFQGGSIGFFIAALDSDADHIAPFDSQANQGHGLVGVR